MPNRFRFNIMKKFMAAMASCFALYSSLSLAASLDPPHDNGFGAGCVTCHDMTAYDQPNMIPVNGHTPQNIDDSLYNNVCWTCHDDITAPMRETHSSRQTDNGYGDWTVECVTCHNQHTQEQDREHGTGYGKFIRTRIDLSEIQGAAKNGARTVKFIGNTGANSFADGDATIDGICEVCHTRTNHWRNDGSLAGIGAHLGLEGSNCMTCHPHDQGFKINCDGCHDFPPGLLVFNPGPTGSVTAGVHGAHVAKNYACQYCHKDSVGNGPTHNSGDSRITMGFSLFNGAYEGGAYDGQATAGYNATATAPVPTTVTNTGTKACSNIFCHGRRPNGTLWGGGAYTTPNWDGTVSCGDCHRATNAAPPTSGQHPEHTRPHNVGYNYPCSFCHNDPAVDGSLHGNNLSEVVFSSDPMTQGGIYNGDADMLGVYGTCENIYCHSTVQSSPPGSGPTYRTTPAWNASMDGCDKCHYTWGSVPGLTTGSHDPHLFQYETQQCYACHNWENSDDPCMSCHDAFINPERSKHANYEVNVAFMPSYGGTYTGKATPGDPYGRCDNTYCHSNGTAVSIGAIPANSSPDWGTAGPLPCDTCHGYGPDYPNNIPKANSHDRHVAMLGYTCNTCHYQTTNDGTSISSWATHLNRQYDIMADANVQFMGVNVSFDYAYDPGGGTCSSISCHQSAGYSTTAIWGNTSISASPSWTEGMTCGEVNFGITPTTGTPPYTYSIDWGDGQTYEGPDNSHSHVYAGATPASPDYDVTWSVRDAAMNLVTGAPRTTTVTVFTGNILPTPDFTVSADGLTVTLTDQSFDPDYTSCGHSGPGRVIIDWGPGGWVDYGYILNLTDAPSGQVIDSYTYSSPGTYRIQYGVYDNVISYPEFTEQDVPVTNP